MVKLAIERAGNGTLAALIASCKQDTAFKALRNAGILAKIQPEADMERTRNRRLKA